MYFLKLFVEQIEKESQTLGVSRDISYISPAFLSFYCSLESRFIKIIIIIILVIIFQHTIYI